MNARLGPTVVITIVGTQLAPTLAAAMMAIPSMLTVLLVMVGVWQLMK
jgi:hypothetical protein